MSGKSLRWWRWVRKLGLVSGFVTGGAIALSTNCALAQFEIVPDTAPGRALGTRTEAIAPSVTQIQGGTQQGSNLFHSFSEFNVPDARSVYFENPDGVTNILSRVTGNDPSDILGTLGVGEPGALGTANLFLINPNGIIFGENARLDVAGSFVATTANAIVFGNQGFFSASDPNAPPLLTVNPSAFFFNQIAAAPITNQSVDGLRVLDNQSLLLVGGDVNLNGGILQAPGGRVELGGVTGAGTVGLNGDGNNLSLSFPDGVAKADVTLTNEAEVNVTASSGGSIGINARNLTMAGASRIQAGIAPDLFFLSAQADNIEVNATGLISLKGGSSIDNSVQFGARGRAGNVIINADTVSFDGESSDFRASGAYSRIQEGASGGGGNIEIRARSLQLTNGAIITTSTRGEGNAGNVTIIADTVSFDGKGNFNPGLGVRQSSAAFSAVTAPGVGQGGSVYINTRILSLTNGGAIITDTLGQGTAGNVMVNADTVSLDGRGTDSDFEASGIYSRVGEDAVGNGGAIKVTASSVTLTNGALLSASTSGQGIGGTLTVNARSLSVRDGSEISATSSDSGLGAGNLVVQDSDLVEVIGTSSDGSTPSRLLFDTSTAGDAGILTITTRNLVVRDGAIVSAKTSGAGRGGILTVQASDSVRVSGTSASGNPSQLRFDSDSSGNARGIDISTELLVVENQGKVTVNGTSSGDPGTLKIRADSILLQHRGSLTTETKAGTGGNIRLQVQDLILMRYNSLISASAEGSGNGGNVEIEIPNGLVVAVLSENSDIVASAQSGDGGRASATAVGVFGFRQFIDRQTPESDFTASSELGIDGTLDIDTQDRELEELPADFLAADIAQGCQAVRGRAEDRFVVTGRGGLPPDARETLRSEEPLVGLVTLDSEPQQPSSAVTETNPLPQTTPPIVEATGWAIAPNGEVVLVASASARSSWQTPVDCGVP